MLGSQEKRTILTFNTENKRVNPLQKAAIDGDVIAIAKLLKEGAEVNESSYRIATPLHYAALGGHLEAVTVLLNHGADVNFQFNIVIIYSISPLHFAALAGHAKVVKTLLDAGADVKAATNCGGETPRERDISDYQRAITYIKKLPSETPNVEHLDWYDLTALHYAVISGNLNTVKALLDGGVDVHAADEYGLTALHYAILMGNLEITKFLADYVPTIPAEAFESDEEAGSEEEDAEEGSEAEDSDEDDNSYTRAREHKYRREQYGKGLEAADKYGYTPLFLAAGMGDTAILQALLNTGSDISVRSKNGETLLHAAAAQGRTEMVLMLLKLGADANVANDLGNTPLHCAAKSGNISILNALLAAGADVHAAILEENREDSNTHIGDTALHYAAEKGFVAGVSALLACGAKLKAKSEGCGTPLLSCLWGDKPESVTVLLERGADANDTDERGNSALHIAAKSGSFEAVKHLLAYGAKVNVSNPQQSITPLHLAADAYNAGKHQRPHDEHSIDERAELVELLLENGADAKAVDKSGNTALHYAAIRGLVKAIELLLTCGVDPNAVNNEGKTPLLCIKLYNRKEVCSVLLTHGADPFFKARGINIFNDWRYNSLGELGPTSREEKCQILFDHAWGKRGYLLMLRYADNEEVRTRCLAAAHPKAEMVMGSAEAAGGAASSEDPGAKL